MKCPKCQFDNISDAIFCQKCGTRLDIICPKCGYRQSYSEECAKCGIIFDRYKSQEPYKEKTYKVSLSLLLLIIFLSAGCFLTAGFIYLLRNYSNAGVLPPLAISILCVLFGIAFILFYFYKRSYFVSVNGKGINIANKKIIPWEDIYNIEWNNVVVDNPRGGKFRSKWIDIYFSDEVKGKIVKTKIDHVEDIEFLYERIKKRVSCDIDGLTEPRFSITTAQFVILSIILFAAFVYLSLVFGPEEYQKSTPTNTETIQKKNADVNGKEANRGDTTLMYEAYNGNTDTVQRLLDKGAEVDAKRTNDGLTALWFASQKGHADIVRLLLERGAEVDVKRTTDGLTALQIASIEGRAEVVNLLLDKGAAVDAVYKDGTTALWMAAYNGHVDVVKLLLDNGADLNVKDPLGGTTLIVASNNGHADIVKLLLDKGADVNVKVIINNVEWTALRVATDHGHADIVQLLENAGAKE